MVCGGCCFSGVYCFVFKFTEKEMVDAGAGGSSGTG